MACKFLQAPARSGVSGQQRPRPGGLVAWVTIAAVQPSIPTALVIVGPGRFTRSRPAALRVASSAWRSFRQTAGRRGLVVLLRV